MKKRHSYVLTHEDMRKIYGIATSSRDKFIAYLLYETGLRLSECAALFQEDVVRDYMYQGHYIQLRDRGKLSNGGYLKTGERKIYISSSLYNVYDDYMYDKTDFTEDHPFLLINLRGKRAGQPMSMLSLQKLISRWQTQTGIPLTASIFRYTHGCTYYNATKDINLVHERLGHENLKISIERYISPRNNQSIMVK